MSNNPSVPQSTLFSWFNNFDEGQQQWLLDLARRHRDKINESHQQEAWERMQRFKELWPQGEGPGALPQWREYSVDYWQRSVLFLDLMRQHGNNFIRHEQAGCPPVLAYDYELIVDGSELPRPANYALVRIVPPEGTPQREDGRPYIIIDPRAGHGSGIGGFKNESEVGVALLHGHPVYFVIFYQHPMPDQTLADVCAAEAEFARTVQRRHPQAPHPIVIGNCQGGWAAMLLAAANPDLTGPVVVNGAPLSYWSGEVGKNAMRYLGGLYGGILPALMLSDLGDGEFDGANLVLNFEMLNPGNTWWRKYYDMFAHVDSEAPRYLDFERWWSGFFFMNEAEIGWILDNLFIGNKLARGQANLDERTHIDLRNIRSPIIVFASHGDNITPPQQALGWITDNYATEAEIKSRAQRILYTLHDHIGHLGIFVSSKVAKKQHQEIVSTLKTIEALPPGLYEIVITRVEGDGVDKRYTVEFEERALADIAALSGDREHEEAFATVARMSALGAEIYDLTWRPLIKASVNNATARACVRLNPLRQRRYAFSDRNPMMAAVPTMADKVREARKPVSADNPFLQWERLWADSVAQTWDWCRDVRDAWYELCFYQMFGSPMARALGESLQWRISDAPQEDLRALTDVQSALDRMEEGGFAAAVIRMLILLAKSRGSVRRSRLERSNEMLSSTEPFASMRLKKRTRLIHRQSLIVDFEPEQALETLANLIADPDERRRALEICEHVAGPAEDMTPTTVAMLERFKALFKISDEPSIKSAMPTQTAA